jgi:phage-related protein
MLTDFSVSKRNIQKLSQFLWLGDSMEPTLWTADFSKELLHICQTTQHNIQENS